MQVGHTFTRTRLQTYCKNNSLLEHGLSPGFYVVLSPWNNSIQNQIFSPRPKTLSSISKFLPQLSFRIYKATRSFARLALLPELSFHTEYSRRQQPTLTVYQIKRILLSIKISFERFPNMITFILKPLLHMGFIFLSGFR